MTDPTKCIWEYYYEKDAHVMLAGQYVVRTTLEFTELKKNGQPRKNAKYRKWCLFRLHHRAWAEHIVMAHNMFIVNDIDKPKVLEEYIDAKAKSMKKEVLNLFVK